MRTFRGNFPGAPNIAACFTEAAGGGNIRNIDAPRNAPAKTPAAHLDKVAFHSQFYNYELAMPVQTITVTHGAVPNRSIVWGYEGIITRTVVGGVSSGQLTLLAHGLGYTPLVLVSWNGTMLVAGTAVQSQTEGFRFVSVFADSAIVGLGECAYGEGVDLPAVTRTYQVMVFRTRTPDPQKASFSGSAKQFQIGREMINSQKQYLKRAGAGAAFNMDFDRTVDIGGGRARIVTGGVAQTEARYSGSFTGGSYLPVGV